jgi:DNA-directed RNA polymerase subunit RPC12/RpoP
MTEKPSNQEEEFFAREEAEKLYRLHQEKLKSQDAAAAEAEKKAHYMKCPKCGYGLEAIQWRKVEVDKCFRCGVVVLDDGELEQLAGQENAGGFIASLSTLFKG